ncbi:MAG TPA: hypothetical protein ENJ00_00665 [Phycisphaerales bacterium]|nr:hypothetical protein [Phycisphaerales bacterium]
MRIQLVVAIGVLLTAVPAGAQIQRNGIWIGSDAHKGNPHGLADEVLHRPPVECGELLPPNVSRGVYEPASWPNDTIPFRFDPNVTPTNRFAMLAAMANVAHNCKIKFVWQTDEADYIYILDSNSNSSFVGRIGGAQDINIFNWNFEFIMVHELYHAIGIWHEQSAPSRDSFVNIFLDNVLDGFQHNFNIRPNANETPYDYDSVMHYGPTAFSSNGQNTIETIDPQYMDDIGQRDHISSQDVATIRIMHEDPVPTEWVMNNVVYLNPNGDFDNCWSSILDALNAAPSGSRVVNANEHTFDMPGILILNKYLVIDGKRITLE